MERLELRSTSSFCGTCAAKINYLCAPFCRICGVELYGLPGSTPLCGGCLKSPPPFSAARSVVWYDHTVRDLLLRLKFARDTAVLPGLKEIICHFDSRLFADVDWIIPVPLHRTRLRGRGLNQAVVLSGLFFQDRLKRLRTDLLARRRYTQPQTRLSGVERRKNLRDAFEIRNPETIKGALVCLVDDVYTTGTTVRECSKTLLQGGAGEVRVLTLARVKVPWRK